VSGASLCEAIQTHGHRSVRYAPDRDELVRELARQAAPGDVIVALGAGDVNRLLGDLEQIILHGEMPRGGTDGEAS
jgi:UDP-N-acetylmuramate-alanine ligase